jgi:hypothetical protein
VAYIAGLVAAIRAVVIFVVAVIAVELGAAEGFVRDTTVFV